ncbi:MAG TPA: DUF58 domain-containing protein [Clostridiales bacterium]|jgi:uncharacterized protein (DUF58 family)|nr:DUF58 domain-containing protein [Clostridiales bacterium]
MILDYITKIKANISIHTNIKATSILDGSYKSVFMGKSLNFEDLREYIPGDNIRDIDWKASSRSRMLLVKRYIAEKKHNILLVFDSGVKMNAETDKGESKKDVAIYTAGTLSYLAYSNGDFVGSLYNIDGKMRFFPLRNRLYDIEHFLAQYDKDVKSSNTSDLNKTLEYLLKNFRRKMVVFVITDIKGASEVSEAVLKKLICQHDILFVQVNDADLTGGRSFKVENNRYLPRFVTMNKKLASMEKNIKKKITEENEKKLMHHAILSTNVSGKDDITMKITELLERHRYANIR